MNEITKQSKEDIAKQIEELGLDIYLAVINDDGSVDFTDGVDISSKSLKEIPIKFGTIQGDFICSNNQLVSLKNSPHTITGGFQCSTNQLTSLEQGPTNVGGGYFCSLNKLESLKGSPKVINGAFDCSHNNLSTLKYGPEIIEGGYWCSYNNLETLEHGPNSVKESFDCEYNELKNLKYCPKIVFNLYASNNQINSLKYFPEVIKGYATLYNNVIQDIHDLTTCIVGGNLALGWKKQSPEKNLEENLEKKLYTCSEIALKFKTDEVNALEKSLNDNQNNSKISTKRKIKL